MEKGIHFDKTLQGSGLRVGIVVARWNEECTGALEQQVIAGLSNRGVTQEDIVRCSVPGSYELVHGATMLIEKERVDVVIPIGVLVKGETMHFEYIAEAVSHGFMALQLAKNIPIIFGVLTCLTQEQALVRSVGDKSHGDAWAATAIEMGLLAR